MRRRPADYLACYGMGVAVKVRAGGAGPLARARFSALVVLGRAGRRGFFGRCRPPCDREGWGAPRGRFGPSGGRVRGAREPSQGF